MNYVAIDTDVASVSLRGRLPAEARRHLAGKSICLTFVTVGELSKWMALRNWGASRRRSLLAWQHGKVVLPYDEAVAGIWGELQARAQRRGRPRPANDTWVAACCLVDDLPLATFNLKDFEDFATYDGLRLIPTS